MGWAQDRASDAEEMYRILGLTHRLGGEVWRVGERTYWFREALHPRTTAFLDPPAPLPESPYTRFLFELAGKTTAVTAPPARRTRARGRRADSTAVRRSEVSRLRPNPRGRPGGTVRPRARTGSRRSKG